MRPLLQHRWELKKISSSIARNPRNGTFFPRKLLLTWKPLRIYCKLFANYFSHLHTRAGSRSGRSSAFSANMLRYACICVYTCMYIAVIIEFLPFVKIWNVRQPWKTSAFRFITNAHALLLLLICRVNKTQAQRH